MASKLVEGLALAADFTARLRRAEAAVAAAAGGGEEGAAPGHSKHSPGSSRKHLGECGAACLARATAPPCPSCASP